MQKIRYETDPYNRLMIAKAGGKTDGKSGLRKFRKVIDGRFRIDRKNELTYHVKSPLSGGDEIPNQIKLKGIWSLTKDHELRLTLDKGARETFGDELTLRGQILEVDGSSLSFALTTISKGGTRTTYTVELSGMWKADERNRLTFHVKKEAGTYDILTFTGAWEINKDHQIVYGYEKARLIRKRRQTHTLVLKGHWDIREKGRISYAVSGTTDSVFEFEAAAGIFKERYIQYEVGIRLTERRREARRIVKLFGAWKVMKGLGLIFEVSGENGKPQAIVFGGEAKLTDRDSVVFRLRNDIAKRDLGATVELSRRILRGDGEAFVRALASRAESAVYAGAGWRW